MSSMITESNYEIKTSINESEDGKKELFIEGIFASAEKKNKNGRIYPKSILEREIKKVSKSVNENSCVGEMNHPIDRSEVDLNEACIKVTKLNWKGNDVYGKAKVLTHTPKGKLLEGLILDKVKIGISSRGLGTVSEGNVNDDFQLLTWDIVNNPSNHGSFVSGILEGVEFGETKKVLTEEEKEQIKLKEEIKSKELKEEQKEKDRQEKIYDNVMSFSESE